MRDRLPNPQFEKQCPACGLTFLGDRRRIWCSRGCRQKGFHMRRDWPEQAPIVFRRRLSPAVTVFRCPACGTRALGQDTCPACATPSNSLGPGGPCPHCSQPVAVVDVMPVLPVI